MIHINLRRLDRLIYFAAFLFLMMAAASMTSAVRIKYVDAAVANYEQLLSITKPYLTELGKEELIRSASSQIRNKGDYEKIIVELRSIAQKNGQQVPDFMIW